MDVISILIGAILGFFIGLNWKLIVPILQNTAKTLNPPKSQNPQQNNNQKEQLNNA